MFNTEKYFHLFLMISEFILAVMLLTLFIFGIKIIINKDKYEILWIGSKRQL